MKELTHLSLCSGIGGIDLAAEWAGFKTVAQCELDEYASKVLAKNFKGVHNFGDIRTVTAELAGRYGIERGEITVISAGFPCQPYSLAGKGLGDSDSRDLWGEVARVCGELKPKWFVGENTPGLFARANQRYFRRILDDLTALGYTVGWGIWGACDVGAPHKRDRVFIVARNSDCNDEKEERAICERKNAESDRVCGNVSDGNGIRELQSKGSVKDFRKWIGYICEDVSYADGDATGGLSCRAKETQPVFGNDCGYARAQWWKTEPDVGGSLDGVSDRLDKIRGLSNETKNRARKILSDLWKEIGEETIQREIGGYDEIQCAQILLSVLCKYAIKCNKSGTALESGTVAKGEMRDLWKQIKSSCTSCRRGHRQQYAGEYPNSLRKLSCEAPSYYAQAWKDGSWECGIERISIKCPHRVDRLRCLGNAVVPQQIYPIFEKIAEIERRKQ